MSLHAGLDTVGIISHGVYTKTYGVGEEANVASIYASFGYLESATGRPPALSKRLFDWFWEYIG